jgi:hypothetical protein
MLVGKKKKVHISHKHPLYDPNRIKENTIFTDPKTNVRMIACDQPFESLGAGFSRNLGIKVLDHQPRNKIISISEKPLELMDLSTYTIEEYIKYSWYIHGEYAVKPSEFPMLGNTRAPRNGHGDFEEANCILIYRSLPKKDGLSVRFPPGIYVYIRTLVVMQPGEFVRFEKYGSGPNCLLWGQMPTMKRQMENMLRYEINEIERMQKKQKGNETCPRCGFPSPRSAKKKLHHRIICPESQVKGVFSR